MHTCIHTDISTTYMHTSKRKKVPMNIQELKNILAGKKNCKNETNSRSDTPEELERVKKQKL